MVERSQGSKFKRERDQNSRGVRIIAGQWRGRRIRVAATTALRPTPDRVRETLFSWLAPTLAGSRCLDLFAGTGVLGWEALSRGAATVTFVERDRLAVQALLAQQQTFSAEAASIVLADADNWLQGKPEPFDLVFLDPPYSAALEPWLQRLDSTWLAPTGCIYIERGSQQALDAVESFGRFRRRARAGSVHYGLLERGLQSSG